MDAGPRTVLIETGARPEGAYAPAAMRQATGTDHLGDAATALVTGLAPSTRRPSQHVTRVSLISPTDGTLNPELLAALRRLPTLAGTTGDLTPGRHVRKTRDLPTSPGRLHLADPDPGRIETDYRTIRHLERAGLYEPSIYSPHCTR